MSGSVIRCDVHPLKQGRYCVRYLPTDRGQHELTVKVNGQEIADSPRLVCACISPSKLHQPVRVFNKVSIPNDVAVNSRGDIVVTERVGNIVIFNSEGEKQKRITYQLGQFTGITMDMNDNVYVSGKSNWIMKFDDKMNVVKQRIDSHGHQLPCPISLFVLYLCCAIQPL